MERQSVGILIFENVEVLDFAGPYEVFSRTRLEPGVEARRTDESAPFSVFTVSESGTMLRATGGLRVTPDHSFDTHPHIDLLVVPGGFGTRPLIGHARTIEWVRKVASEAGLVTSVCTGSLLLASAGLLEGKRATTHWAALDELEGMEGVTVERSLRVVRDGVITSAGVASGIDMAFDVVEMLHGPEVANETAKYIEYRRSK